MPIQGADVEAVKAKIDAFDSISILTHLNPDADTLGTGLGIYHLLKKDKRKRVEIVNVSNALPRNLDFLPGYTKVKSQMNFEKSLIIACDCGSIDRLGCDLEGRDILNIDHHHSNQMYGSVNIVIPEYASASQVAYVLFKEIYEIKKETALCFYVALLSDTQYFTTASVTAEVFLFAKTLLDIGVDPAAAAQQLTQRKPLSSLRILHKALGRLSLSFEGKAATLFVTQNDMLETGAKMADLEGIIDHARALVTVEIAVFVIESDDSLRVSLRSKEANVSKLATVFGGGGHRLASGFTLTKRDIHETIDIILQNIQKLGLLDG